ncbi:hypothetical protein ACXZ65_31165 [Streptomyces aculeolatus]
MVPTGHEVLGQLLGWWSAAVVALAPLRWFLAGAAAVLAAAVGGLAAWWRRRAVAELRQRVRLELVPAQTFDPSREVVSRFARQLDRVPATARTRPRRAGAVRFRLRCREQRLHFYVEGPYQARSLLRPAPFAQVEVREGEGDRPVQGVRFAGAPPVHGGDWGVS